MRTSRQHDGEAGPEKMSPFERINTEFGAWKPSTPTTPTSTTTPSIMMRNDMMLNNDHNPRTAAPLPPAPTSSPASANGIMTRSSCTTFNSRGTCNLRYSKIDTFIEDLDAACDALPTPLVGAAPSLASRVTPPKVLLCSSTKQQNPHLFKTQRQQEEEVHRPLLLTGEIVRELKCADEVIEIGESEGMVAERPFELTPISSERKFFEGRSMELRRRETKMLMAEDGAGAPPPRVSRALRFDYRKKRSDFVKAATLVQSTYRGYKVRRGQPLKYLLVISSVKERLEELRQQFDAWKIAAWFPTDLSERVTMTESVMDLLLRLDSLQGVPAVVREFRKNVARDVIKFQEEVDGFLCRNSKHGVLFDLTRPGLKAAQGSSNLKPFKTIRNIVVQEPDSIENLPESDSRPCSSRQNGSWTEDAKVGTMSSIAVTSGLESDCHSKIKKVPVYSVQHGSTGRNFVLWSPRDAKFEKMGIEEKRSEANELENVTELKKCVASAENSNICVPSDRKKKSLRVRFGIVSFGSTRIRKEHLSIDDECPNAPQEDISPWNSACVEPSLKDMHHPPDILSWEPTGNLQQKDDSQWMVSINKERCVAPYANGRIQFSDDDRIRDVHETLLENRENRYPRTHARPQTPAQSHHSLTEKWDAELPAQPHFDNSIETHESNVGMENGQDREVRHPQTRAQPDYALREKWVAEFPADLRYDNHDEITKTCTGTEKTPAAMFEPVLAKDEDLHIAVEEVIRKDLYNEQFKSQTNRQAFPSRVEYVSAKDVREGTIEPLLASDQEDSEMDYPVAMTQLDCPSQDTFGSFGGYDYIESSAAMSIEGNRMGTLQDMPNGVNGKEGDPCTIVTSTDDGEKLGKLEIPRIEAVESRQPGLRKKTENPPMLLPPTSILNGKICEQIDGQPENEYDPCSFDDLETISSCSNCATYPVDCISEPYDIDSGIHEQVQHQPYALKGLVRELDEVFSERKGGEKRCFEAHQWKDEAWKDYTTGTEFQSYHIAPISTRPNFEREVEVEREDGSCTSFKTVESDKVQYSRDTEPKFTVETELVLPPEEEFTDIEELTCQESTGSNLACTSQSLGAQGVASGSTCLVPHEKESNVLSKLVEDNKRLKELLKEVMKWNTVQANAMIMLNERLELVESKK